jgi:hypothetical protein
MTDCESEQFDFSSSPSLFREFWACSSHIDARPVYLELK